MSLGEQISDMSFQELKTSIDRIQAGLTVTNPVCARFLKSVHAVSKSLGHTSEAAKGARMRILGDMIRFGASAIFLMVMPDDSNCLRLQIYTKHQIDAVPDPMTSTNEEIKADYDLCIQLRQTYSGLCAFDFHQITELMIEYILGWNRQEQISHEGGGVFGELDAWSATIKEQERKTLHSHWILYVKQWSKLLKGLYSNIDDERNSASLKLKSYVNAVMSTKLFGIAKQGQMTKEAYKHECTATSPSMPELCSNQDLRNLRYSYGKSSFNDDNIAKCRECGKPFSVETLVNNVLTKYFGSEDELIPKMRLAVKRYSSQM